MKKNMKRTMERLEIDEELYGLMRQLWKHCYRTHYSCSGHGVSKPYLMFERNSGDGWFERNSGLNGFYRVENGICCRHARKKEREANCCFYCGNGIRRFVRYDGRTRL